MPLEDFVVELQICSSDSQQTIELLAVLSPLVLQMFSRIVKLPQTRHTRFRPTMDCPRKRRPELFLRED